MAPFREYRGRVVDGELDELIPGLPAIAIEGAKGVGKTRTASLSSRHSAFPRQHRRSGRAHAFYVHQVPEFEPLPPTRLSFDNGYYQC
jgi:hypothetical protein